MWPFLIGCFEASSPPTAVSERGNLDVRLEVSGELEARDTEYVINPISGWTKIETMVDDGERVEAGDEVLKMDMEHEEKRVIELGADLERIDTRIAQERSRLSLKLGDAKAEVIKAKLDRELAELRKTDSKAVARIERIRGQIAATKADMTVSGADAKLRRIELDAQNSIRLLQIDAVLKRSKLASYKRQIEASTVYTPSAGVVLVGRNWRKEKFKTGDDLYFNARVLSIPNLSVLDVEAWVPEVDSPKVEVGQSVRITLDAEPETVVDGTIQEVALVLVEHGDNEAMHKRVLLEMDETRPNMKPGMTVSVDVRVSTLEDVVLVPPNTVFLGTDGPFVATSEVDFHPIQVLGEEENAIAVSGIEAGTHLWTFDPRAWARGRRPTP